MCAMVRTHLFLESRQVQELKRLASERGLPQAELVRRAIDGYLECASDERAVSWSGIAAVIEERRALVGSLEPAPRAWRRDDAQERGGAG